MTLPKTVCSAATASRGSINCKHGHHANLGCLGGGGGGSCSDTGETTQKEIL